MYSELVLLIECIDVPVALFDFTDLTSLPEISGETPQGKWQKLHNLRSQKAQKEGADV